MRERVVLSLMLSLSMAACSSSDGSSSIEVSFSPQHGTAGYPLDVAVTATFSPAVTAPDSWAGVVTLRKWGDDTNLCTADEGDDTGYRYSSGVLTCLHDDLEPSEGYVVTVEGGIIDGVSYDYSQFGTGDA